MRRSIVVHRLAPPLLTLALVLGAALSPGPTFATSDEAERERICAKAEKRYQELFGKPSSAEPVVIVTMYKYTFCPTVLTVKRGTTVRWVNVDKRTSHSVWLKEAGKEESDRLFPEESWEITYDVPPGEYPYLCGPHGKEEGMTGKVIVTP